MPRGVSLNSAKGDPMRKLGFFAVTAVILAGFGAWIATTTQAQAPTKSPQIDALGMMTAAGNLPTEQFVDYSLVYE
jgi:hypothetical protein